MRDTPLAIGLRWGRLLLVAVHVVVIQVPATQTSFGVAGLPASGNPLIAYPLAAAILALQLRHSLAIARGQRPRGAMLSMFALVLLVYAPIRWFGWNWAYLQACVMASAPLLFPGRRAVAAAAFVVVGTDIAALGLHLPLGLSLLSIAYITLALCVEAAALYITSLLLGMVEQLRETYTYLASTAIAQERLRISRDLHDFLGQSVTAVSLKGDLTLRLLESNPPAARHEIESLMKVATDSLRGMKAVSRGEHLVTLQNELEGAQALLAAAGITAEINVDLPGGLSPAQDSVLAWAVREGVANALRHSQARQCAITVRRQRDRVFLKIVNDGAAVPGESGTGLVGISARARALSGIAASHRTADGQFELSVDLPEVTTRSGS